MRNECYAKALERQIDCMVCQLYGLTAEEIATVAIAPFKGGILIAP
ncbi:MAG: hypothetical protein IPL33_13580 [Sphingobacteriales bacterium]|nr:hypothetical protein [Sphingobacteriales bacterium]MCC7225031.1 hypothetical protein [Chitinophagales bacterium]